MKAIATGFLLITVLGAPALQTPLPDIDIGRVVSEFVAAGPLLALMIYFYRSLEKRHSDLYERYVVLQNRYIRDVRTLAKLPESDDDDTLSRKPVP